MRADISSFLVHWTRDETTQAAFERLIKIVYEQRLLGSSELRKGSYKTVCFTEAPFDQFHRVTSRYSPFGIKITKSWAFSRGARPVVYQKDSEFSELAEGIRWRHVRYEPDLSAPIDFSWEREWRVPTENLSLEGSGFSIVLPDRTWLNALFSHHKSREEYRIYAEVVGYGEWAGWQDPRPFQHGVELLDPR